MYVFFWLQRKLSVSGPRSDQSTFVCNRLTTLQSSVELNDVSLADEDSNQMLCNLWTVISDLMVGDLLFVDVNLPFADNYLSYKGW